MMDESNSDTEKLQNDVKELLNALNLPDESLNYLSDIFKSLNL